MSDPPAELSELAARVDAAVTDGSMASERAVQLRAAEPLIEVLGWNLRGEAVTPAATIDDQTVDYLLHVESEPIVAVVTAAPENDLERTTADRLRPVLEATAVSRGIATDGRQVTLLAGTDTGVHAHAFPFEALPDHADALGQFHRSSLAPTVADERRVRRDAAKRIASESTSLEDEVTTAVLEVTGSDVEEIVRAEVDRFLADLVETLAPDDATLDEEDRSNRTSDGEGSDTPGGSGAGSGPGAARGEDPGGSDGGGTAAARVATETGEERPAESGPTAQSESDSGGTIQARPGAGDAPDTDGSYVARFFGGSSSVGAVGTGSPRTTVVGVVRYLLENQDLRRSVTYPWEVEPGTPVVAENRPSPEWIALEHPEATDVYVRPVDDPRAAKVAIEELADAVGLRVMFQGDW